MRNLLRRSLMSTLFVLVASVVLVQTEAAPRGKVLDRVAPFGPTISNVSQSGFNLQMLPISFERILVIRIDGRIEIVEFEWVAADSGINQTDGLHDDNDPWFGDSKDGGDKQEDDSNNPNESNEEGPLDGILHDIAQGGSTTSDDEQP